MIVQSTVTALTVAMAGLLATETTAVGVNSHLSSMRPASPVSYPIDSYVKAGVAGVSLVPGENGAELLISISSVTKVVDFTLENPNRLVFDLVGATLTSKPRAYDRKVRGNIRDLRVAQFATDTVRVVLELTRPQSYVIQHEADMVRISMRGEAGFARWDMAPQAFSPEMKMAVAEEAVEVVKLAEPAATLASQTSGLANVSAEALTAEPAIVPVIVPTPVVRVDQAGSIETSSSSFASVDAPATVPVPLAIPPKAEVHGAVQLQPSQQPRISINMDGTDIRDVIATFGAFSGRTILVGKNVEGTVTGDVVDKPWDVALQAILQSQGLAATEDPSGIITVDSYGSLAQNQALEPLVTQIVNVNYAKATSLVPTVRALLARDCSSLTTMQAGRDMGVGMAQQGGMGSGAAAGRGGMQDSQGCVLRGSVSADSATNKLIISEVPTRLPELIRRLQELDVRTPQVAIKAKIIFINRTGIQDIGLAYDLGTGNKQFFQQLVPRTDPSTLIPVDTDGDGVPDARGGGTPFEGPARIALGGNAISGIANANNAIKPNALNLIYSTALGRYQLTAFLNALQTSSLADVQSEPSVTILNNRTAEIFVGQEIPIRVIDASAGGAGGNGGGGGGGGAGQDPSAQTFFPRASVQIKEAGIRLSVTPQVTNNRMVVLNIKAENSNAEVGPSDVGIIFNQQRAESQVLVADGEAAVIGGLTVTEVSRFRSGIPFLMDLPIAGRLFSQNSTNETKRDLLILVTPHILEDGVTPPPAR